MRGEFIGIWSELKREIWEPLAQLEDAPDDLFCELFRTISVAFNVQLSAEEGNHPPAKPGAFGM